MCFFGGCFRRKGRPEEVSDAKSGNNNFMTKGINNENRPGLREFWVQKQGLLHNVGKRKIPDLLLLSLVPQVHERKEGEVYFQNTEPLDTISRIRLPLLSLHIPLTAHWRA